MRDLLDQNKNREVTFICKSWFSQVDLGSFTSLICSFKSRSFGCFCLSMGSKESDKEVDVLDTLSSGLLLSCWLVPIRLITES